ncbi:MAG: hypothetical protein ACFFC7_06755 [Candidatus Hermodarchaeota archaeon]
MNQKKQYKVEIFWRGKLRPYFTDLKCNVCGEELKVGTYMYICPRDGDDLCTRNRCRGKHAGHGAWRFWVSPKGPKTGPYDTDLTIDTSSMVLIGPVVATRRVPAITIAPKDAIFEEDI